MNTKILDFISQPIPENIGILAHSIPIPFFGNIEKSIVATLSLNPSDKEFRQDRHPSLILANEKKRFKDRDFFDITDKQSLTKFQAEIAYDSYLSYFKNNPYKKWFNKLDSLLSPVGFSYYDGTMSHLDITPWATFQKWDNLNTKDAVLNASANISEYILDNYDLKFLFVNGKTTFSHLQKYYQNIENVTSEAVMLADKQCIIYTAQLGNCKIIGWNLYIHYGLSSDNQKSLTLEIKKRLF